MSFVTGGICGTCRTHYEHFDHSFDYAILCGVDSLEFDVALDGPHLRCACGVTACIRDLEAIQAAVLVQMMIIAGMSMSSVMYARKLIGVGDQRIQKASEHVHVTKRDLERARRES